MHAGIRWANYNGGPSAIITALLRRTRSLGWNKEDDMQLEQRIVGDVAIVKVTGDITLNRQGNVLLKDKVQSLLHQGYKNLLLDLSGVSHVDSAGLGEMVQAYVSTKNRGGSLRLLHLTRRIRDLLVVTKLLTVFDAYESEAEALASFGAKPT
jgi:anti-sigma B factor antagonist